MALHHVIHRFLSFVVTLSGLFIASASAQPCRGTGTVVFYGNGMFNSFAEANKGRNKLKSVLAGTLSADEMTRIKFDVAYQGSESVLLQFADVAVQKGVTEFENFWAWLSSLQAAPQWFKVPLENSWRESGWQRGLLKRSLQKKWERRHLLLAVMRAQNMIVMS